MARGHEGPLPRYTLPGMSPGKRSTLVSRNVATLGAIAGLAILLALLATLQWRWIGEVSQAERERLERSLTNATTRFIDEIDRELARAALVFQFDPPNTRSREPLDPAQHTMDRHLARGLDRWDSTSRYPKLLADVFVLQSVEDPGLGDLEGGLLAKRFDPSTDTFEPVLWSQAPQSVKQLSEVLVNTQSPAPVPRLDADLPALLLPVDEQGRGLSFRRRFDWPERAPFWTVLLLDEQYLEQELFPTLVDLHFGAGTRDAFDVAIVRQKDGKVLFASPPDLSAPLEETDASIDFFTFRPYPDLFYRRGRSRPPERSGRPRGAGPTKPGTRSPEGPDPAPRLEYAYAEGQWLLQVRHREGSLASAVERTRRNNLAVGLGVLALLGAAMAMLIVSTRRAQRLAHQQLEFVAGITHELNTPLAALRAAGQNLADGVVTDSEKVQRYGSLVLREGKRLGGLVAQALELAGMQSDRNHSLDRRPVEIGALLSAAAEESDWLQSEYGASVEIEIEPDLAPIEADSPALARVLDNLVTNAIKYGSLGKGDSASRVSLRARGAGDSVVIEVEDHGPGIPPEERPHLFEPFFRGRLATEGTIPGSGVGLALVDHLVDLHGGSVDVDSDPGRTVFRVTLPRAA